MSGGRSIPSRVLVIDDEESVREGCAGILGAEGYQVDTALDVKGGIDRISRNPYDVVLLDMRLPDMGGMEAISRIQQEDSEPVIVMITGFPTVATAVEAIKKGAFDYLPKPFTPEQLLFHVGRAVRKRIEDARMESLKRSLRRREDEVRIVAESGAMKKIMELAGKVAAGESTILITGESGTGKEVIARHIHRLSPRDSSEFVAVDCSALVEGLIESELFGHVRGAFTGAWRSSRGSLELADGGTLFFDEVSNLSLPVQSKILRTIQEREIRRIGDPRPISVDLRIIAATNRDLKEAVEAGVFREDLFYRLNVFPISMPPLRERAEDILPLASEFLRIFTKRKRKEIEGFDEGSRKFLLSYGWPGNVRELQNVIDRAVTVEEGSQITLGAMLIEPLSWPKKGAASSGEPAGEGFGSTLLRDAEARHIGKVLEAAAWNKGKAARLLGIDKKTLVSKIRRYNLQKG